MAQAPDFNWDDFFLSGQAHFDEHWMEGELVGELDLQPVLAPSSAPTGPAAAGTPAAAAAGTSAASTPAAGTPPAGTTAAAA
jgi:hypothetical protein